MNLWILTHRKTADLQLNGYNTISNDPSHPGWSLGSHWRLQMNLWILTHGKTTDLQLDGCNTISSDPTTPRMEPRHLLETTNKPMDSPFTESPLAYNSMATSK